MMPDPDPLRPVHGVLSTLRTMSGLPRVTLRELLHSFGPTSFLPALMVPALIVVSPLSGIPLLPTVCGLTIALIAVQMLFGRRFLWLPGLLMNRRISGARLKAALAWLEGPGNWLDRRTRARIGFIWVWPFSILPTLSCILCGLAMPALELIPFSSTILGAAVTCFAVGFLVRDGVFALIGAMLMAIAAAIPLTILDGLGF